MIFGFGILATALLLSAVAAWYSVAGLTAIFSAAVLPVIIMGGSLELGKIVATVWLHNNWKRAGIVFKLYLIPAIAFLMILTSMGIFGYLSKAHSDQSLVSGDVVSKIAIYDEKIKTEKENIEANRRALKQMDEGVDQVLGRSTTETGAEKAVAMRRAQQKERARLQAEISQSQKSIAELNDARAPIAAEVRKVDAEVGPIKYIAALLYGDNPDDNLLERAVRWMIIMIVLVFDPLALTLILAANKQFEWARQGTGGFVHDEPRYEPDDGPLTDEQIEQIQASAEPSKDPHPVGWMFGGKEDERPWNERYPYLAKPFDHFKDLKPMVYKAEDATTPEDTIPCHKCGTILLNAPGIGLFCPNKACDVIDGPFNDTDKQVEIIFNQPLPVEEIETSEVDPDAAVKAWKAANPDDTIKAQRTKLARGQIDHLPWQEPPATTHAFGTEFPDQPNKGDTYLKVDAIPSRLYKYNGKSWIHIDKDHSDNYTYDTAYIDYLIAKIDSGEYDPDLLSDLEQEQIAARLNPETKI
jgi:hypothetical protein